MCAGAKRAGIAGGSDEHGVTATGGVSSADGDGGGGGRGRDSGEDADADEVDEEEDVGDVEEEDVEELVDECDVSRSSGGVVVLGPPPPVRADGGWHGGGAIVAAPRSAAGTPLRPGGEAMTGAMTGAAPTRIVNLSTVTRDRPTGSAGATSHGGRGRASRGRGAGLIASAVPPAARNWPTTSVTTPIIPDTSDAPSCATTGPNGRGVDGGSGGQPTPSSAAADVGADAHAAARADLEVSISRNLALESEVSSLRHEMQAAQHERQTLLTQLERSQELIGQLQHRLAANRVAASAPSAGVGSGRPPPLPQLQACGVAGAPGTPTPSTTAAQLLVPLSAATAAAASTPTNADAVLLVLEPRRLDRLHPADLERLQSVAEGNVREVRAAIRRRSTLLTRRGSKPGVAGPAAVVGGRARLVPPTERRAGGPPAAEPPPLRPVSVGPTGRAPLGRPRDREW